MSSILTSEILEAVLLAAGSATVNVNDIVDYYAVTEDPKEVKRQLKVCIDELKEKYSGNCGVHFIITDNKTMAFSTNPAYGEDVANIMDLVKEKELSKSLLETLSIIAYIQPATKSEIEEYRNGRNCDYAMGKLMQEGLIETVGQRETTGKPYEYGTTNKFLVKFNLSDLSELPNVREVKEKFKELNARNEASEMFAEKHVDDSDIDPEDAETIKGIIDEENQALEQLRKERAAQELAAAEQRMREEEAALEAAKELLENAPVEEAIEGDEEVATDFDDDRISDDDFDTDDE